MSRWTTRPFGSRPNGEARTTRATTCAEFAHGIFERRVTLPTGIDPERLSARYDAGILEVRIAYEGAKAVKVPVKIGSAEHKALTAAS